MLKAKQIIASLHMLDEHLKDYFNSSFEIFDNDGTNLVTNTAQPLYEFTLCHMFCVEALETHKEFHADAILDNELSNAREYLMRYFAPSIGSEIKESDFAEQLHELAELCGYEINNDTLENVYADRGIHLGMILEDFLSLEGVTWSFKDKDKLCIETYSRAPK